MNTNPLVSIAIRTRNRAGYLNYAVESILNQSYPHWELIISDDASSDNTQNLCRMWEAKTSKIKAFRHEPGLGAADNWRFCLSASRGEYFVALDDDNVFLPNFIEKTVTALKATPDATFAFTDEWRIDSEGVRDISESDKASRYNHRSSLREGLQPNSDLLAVQQAYGINASLFRREALVSTGGFRKLAGDFADFDVFLNMTQQGHKSYYVPERLVEYRQHLGQDGGTYLTSISKALSKIAILEACSFQNEAEHQRLQKLLQSYLTLSRVMLLNNNFKDARSAIKKALFLNPLHPKSLLLAGFLNLPPSLIRHALQQRYGKKIESLQS